MDPLWVLVVEDEVIARRGLCKQLGAVPRVEVVGECSNGPAAVKSIRDLRPDVVLLDVEMPGMDGFGVIDAVGVEQMPPVVFVTAFAEHTLRAFDVHAVDYLLKPIDPEKLTRAIHRARERLTQHQEVVGRLSALLADIKSGADDSDRIAIKSGNRLIFVRTAEIDWIGAADNYAELHVGAEVHLADETLSSLEARLAPARFARIHRSRIVNLSRVRELRSLPHGEYELVLEDGTRLCSARGYRERLRRLLWDP
jgi:two-component system LytT family response regulator